MMESILEFLQANPLYAVAAGILIVFLVISLIKKAVYLIVIAILLNLGYGYYLNDIAKDAFDRASDSIDSAVDSAKDVLDQ